MGTMNMFVLTTLCIFALCAQFDPMHRIDPYGSIHDPRWDTSGKMSPIDCLYLLDTTLEVTPIPPCIVIGSLGSTWGLNTLYWEVILSPLGMDAPPTL